MPLKGLGLAGCRPGASESIGPEEVVCSAALPPAPVPFVAWLG